jgi:mannosylglycerate hydrolase
MKKTTASDEKATAHIVSHTHWDREWRYPMWETRLMLMDFMDELVVILEKGLYPGFLMDGQVAPILDYLEVRPEMTERVTALIKSGKLQVGPWYTLPDEYPVDGEALVRNLLWGMRKAQELGGAFKVGYTSFGWGQTAQLPQLYAGFGMDVAMVGKRVSKQRAPACEFIWRAPDGSELLTTRFGGLGRQNFYFKIHLSALFGLYHEGAAWRYDWAAGGIAYHRADREQMEQDHFRLDAPTQWHPETITPELIEECWRTMDESLLPHDRLMMNGCDYTAAQKMFPEMVARLKAVDPHPNRQWVHTTMPKYVDVLRKQLDRSKLAVVAGELRDGPAQALTGNALTTRLYLKRKNKRAQNRLIRLAEPLSVLATMAGAPWQEALLRKGWQFLLDSHPHDSVNGVTQDKTVEDVSSRLDQVIEISDALGNRAMQELVKRIDTSAFADEDVLITVFNSLPYPRREVMEVWVNMPPPSARLASADMEGEGLMLFAADGTAVDTQWQGYSEESYCVAEIHTRAFPLTCRRHKLFFDTGAVPAGGYKIFRAAAAHGKILAARSSELCRTGTLLTAPHSMENEFLRVEMNPNGTFNLTAKRLNRTFPNLNYYEDRGEHGNYWGNMRPMFDEAHSSLGCAARIWSEESGPLQTTLVSEIALRLPSRGIPQQQRRGDELVELVIKTAVTLRAGQEQVEVAVAFENRHQHHYLRAMFPTGLAGATHADAGGHFTVDRRPIRPQGPDEQVVWPDMGTLPQNNFVDVSDGKTGLAFLNDSLTEYEVLDNKERTVALSLLRAVKNWICTELRAGSDFPSQSGGQCLGQHTLRYALRPHAGNWQAANIPLAAELFNVPAIPVQTRRHAGRLPAQQAALFEISNSAVRFSALKKTEGRNTFVLRVYNPTAETQTTNVTFAAAVEKAWLTNLDEARLQAVTPKNGHSVALTLPPHKIVTVEVKTTTKGK